MAVQLNQSELDSILAEVQRDLNSVAMDSSQRLAKAKEDGSDDDSSDSSGPDSSGDSAPAGDSSGSAPPDASASAGPPPDASAGGPPPDASASAPADPAAGQGAPLDVESLKAEYSQLPDDELQMHFVACKAALMEKQAAASASASPDAGAPPGAPPGPSPSPSPAPPPAASPSPPPGPPPGPPPDQSPPLAQKAEISAGKPLEVADAKERNGGLSKSESDLLKAIKAENDDLKAQVDGLTKAVTIAIQKPFRKAVTAQSQLAFLGKNEGAEATEAKTLSTPEIKEKLQEKARDPSLKKSDRILINKFCVAPSGFDVQQIAHLLK